MDKKARKQKIVKKVEKEVTRDTTAPPVDPEEVPGADED
jgi:hypothetical protein